MKTCQRNRKSIALLTVGALDSDEEKQLRAHLHDCESCRKYFNDLAELNRKLTIASRTDTEEFAVSERFHQAVLRALHKAEAKPGLQLLMGRLIGWRTAFAAAAVVAIVAISLFRLLPPPATVMPVPLRIEPAETRALPPPLASEYWLAANHSLDQLDDLLTRQARQGLPPAPRFTVATLLSGEP